MTINSHMIALLMLVVILFTISLKMIYPPYDSLLITSLIILNCLTCPLVLITFLCIKGFNICLICYCYSYYYCLI